MSDLPGYDAWKLAYPPEYDDEEGVCPECGCYLDEGGECPCSGKPDEEKDDGEP